MIAYVVKMFPRFSETFILAEILELERRGRRVEIVSLKKPDDGRFHEELARLSARVRYLPEHFRCEPLRFVAAHASALRRAPFRYARALGLALLHLPSSWKAFARAPLVAEAAESAGCTRLHAHFASLPAAAAMLASVLSGLPFTFTAHAKDIYHRDRSRRLLRRLLERARVAITVSDANVAYLARLAGPGLAEGRIVRIYNGVDLDAFRPPSRPASDGPPLILAVGRLVEKKGFDVLVEACGMLRERGASFRCAIAGKGPLEEALRVRVRRLGLQQRVQLVGPLPRGRVAELLREAAVLAVPSIVGGDGNREGLPTVIPEAMASAVPVVATSVSGIPEAVEDGATGLLVRPADAAALADALETLLGDPQLRAEMGRAARARAERLFDIERNVRELEAVLFGASPPGAPRRAAAAGGAALGRSRP